MAVEDVGFTSRSEKSETRSPTASMGGAPPLDAVPPPPALAPVPVVAALEVVVLPLVALEVAA